MGDVINTEDKFKQFEEALKRGEYFDLASLFETRRVLVTSETPVKPKDYSVFQIIEEEVSVFLFALYLIKPARKSSAIFYGEHPSEISVADAVRTRLPIRWSMLRRPYVIRREY